MKQLLFSLCLLALAACHKGHSSAAADLEGDWSATSIKLNGTAQATTTTLKLNLKTDGQFLITTNLSPFDQPISGAWSVDSETTKLTLAANVWTIHHLSASSLRLIGTVGGKEMDCDFVK